MANELFKLFFNYTGLGSPRAAPVEARRMTSESMAILATTDFRPQVFMVSSHSWYEGQLNSKCKTKEQETGERFYFFVCPESSQFLVGSARKLILFVDPVSITLHLWCNEGPRPYYSSPLGRSRLLASYHSMCSD